MDKETRQSTLKRKHWIQPDALDFNSFVEQVEQVTCASDWPMASSIEQNALIYQTHQLPLLTADADSTNAVNELLAEWAEAFLNGPGIIVIKGAFVDRQIDASGKESRNTATLDTATHLFEQLIETEKLENRGGGDHFAKPGANDRIWNAMEKHGRINPENFLAYYKNPILAMASRAWLGPGYQVTAQVNRVNPGGAAQKAHRDYHLGFMSRAQAASYPAHVHRLSPCLTLQGAIAHCDMPLESGPTLFLPFSQQPLNGYVDYNAQAYQDYFDHNHVQYPLEKGDAMFFNPALMHAAGNNHSRDIYRLANLLQVSSAFGRAIETVDHMSLLQSVYPALLQQARNKVLSETELHNVIGVAAESYPFPTNLDRDLPVDGMAPHSQAMILRDILDRDLELQQAMEVLQAHRQRTLSH